MSFFGFVFQQELNKGGQKIENVLLLQSANSTHYIAANSSIYKSLFSDFYYTSQVVYQKCIKINRHSYGYGDY
jgi:hypothetical protein